MAEGDGTWAGVRIALDLGKRLVNSPLKFRRDRCQPSVWMLGKHGGRIQHTSPVFIAFQYGAVVIEQQPTKLQPPHCLGGQRCGKAPALHGYVGLQNAP